MEPSYSMANEAHNKTKRLKTRREGSVSERGNEGSSSDGCRNIAPPFDFEKHRASFVLKEGEIWAVRDEFGMPRRYALVEKDGDVLTAKVRFLRNYDGYYGYGFDGVPRGLGKFGQGYVKSLYLTAFSHKVVNWKKHGDITVLPMKGEVWAIRADNAETFFKHSTPTLLKYHMVEVLTNFVKYKGMKIVYLVSITGRNGSCFRRHQSAFHVQSEYVEQRFSHQVPCIRVSGAGLLGLDPSSFPLYVDDFETSVEPEITDNYLFLSLLDRKACHRSSYKSEIRCIWAVYDHECRVPQKYVEIHSYGNLGTHELVPLLADDNEKKWREAGLPLACGKFSISCVETEKRFILFDRFCRRNLNHKYIQGVRHICIYPEEGEVWGIYKDYNLAMACYPRGALDYQIVAITETTEKDVRVARLIRVEGFEGLFKRSDLAREAEFLIPIHECYRFSHKIPSHRFDEDSSEEFLWGAFVLDPFLVPQKHGESYSFNDPFLLERSEVRPGWSAIQYIVNKLRNGITSLSSQENSCKGSDNCVTNVSSEQEEIVVENSKKGEREPNIGEISLAKVHASKRMECEAVEPDTDNHIKFYDLDDTKSERNFKLGEVWAFFNGLNGLPLSYARIDKLLNSGGMVDVTLLQPHPMADEEMQWVDANLSMACGTFRASQSTCIEITVLSHKVICEQPSKLFFRVYPRKDEVWAIYNNWNLNWAFSNINNNVQYRLVEIVSDFTQEAGVTVAALVRAVGHENEFKRQLHEGFWQFMTFKGKELLRFSHCIPSLKMTGDQDGSYRVKFSHNGI